MKRRRDFQFPVIDMEKTGDKIREECRKQKLSPRDVQEYLGLGAFQSVYNWFSGRTLPSLDNMYALSALLGMRMEDLIVEKGHDGPRPNAMSGKRSKYTKERLMMYWQLSVQAA